MTNAQRVRDTRRALYEGSAVRGTNDTSSKNTYVPAPDKNMRLSRGMTSQQEVFCSSLLETSEAPIVAAERSKGHDMSLLAQLKGAMVAQGIAFENAKVSDAAEGNSRADG
jgi:hypothetical protein